MLNNGHWARRSHYLLVPRWVQVLALHLGSLPLTIVVQLSGTPIRTHVCKSQQNITLQFCPPKSAQIYRKVSRRPATGLPNSLFSTPDPIPHICIAPPPCFPNHHRIHQPNQTGRSPDTYHAVCIRWTLPILGHKIPSRRHLHHKLPTACHSSAPPLPPTTYQQAPPRDNQRMLFSPLNPDLSHCPSLAFKARLPFHTHCFNRGPNPVTGLKLQLSSKTSTDATRFATSEPKTRFDLADQTMRGKALDSRPRFALRG